MSRLRPFLENVEGLHGRVFGAAQLTKLVEANQLGTVSPAAYTLPLGVSGGAGEAATGLYRQQVEWLDGVVLVVKVAGDLTGAKALDLIEPLVIATINAVAGQDVADMIGTYRLAKGELFRLAAGVLSYQLDFAIEDQLRINR
jgi:hypothetical protein